MHEIWQDIQNYQNLYQISNLGRIRNKNNKIMHTKPSKDGYVRILLYKDGKYKSHYVHILVAKAFIPNPTNKAEVNHIDGNKLNNSVSNLEWCTASENLKHAFKMGLNKPANPMLGRFGKEHPKAIPIIMCDLNDNEIKKYDSMMDASREMNISVSKISACVNGKRKSTGGYHWKHQ